VSAEPFAIAYDLRSDAARARANRDRNVWGVRHTDITFLDDNHVVLTFHPSPDPGWRKWEEIRKGWILEWATCSRG
jgi:hypothetical protein